MICNSSLSGGDHLLSREVGETADFAKGNTDGSVFNEQQSPPHQEEV